MINKSIKNHVTMFYQKIDLRKLYEQMDEPVSMDGDPGIVNSLEGGEPQAAEEFPTEEEMAKKEAVDIAKGRAYAFPVSEEAYSQLNDLIAKGSGDWMSKEPLKLIQDGRGGKAATMMAGGQEKPVYLMVRLSQSKGDAKAKPLNLEAEDRIYVALLTSPENLTSYLDTASNIDKHIRLSVLTPLMKAGKNVEHTIEMWKDFQAEEQLDVASQEEVPNVAGDDVANMAQDSPGLAAQLDLPESVNYRKRYVNGKWTRVNEAETRYEGPRGEDATTKWQTSGSKPEAKPEAAPISIKDFEEVIKTGKVLKVGRSGDAVKALQRFLKIEDDGKFGPATKAAVIKFQKDRGLKPDGIVGKNTVGAIEKAQAEQNQVMKIKPKTLDKIETPKLEPKKVEPVKSPGVQEEEPDTDNMSQDELEAELKKAEDELAAAKGDVKQARKDRREDRREDRKERKDARKDRREDRKEDRKEEKLRKKIERLRRKTGRKEDKADKIVGESKVYSFEEFVKSVNGLQH
jgi:peptidoglycan hydrolase-like protein with peptidoglycan-binding domain